MADEIETYDETSRENDLGDVSEFRAAGAEAVSECQYKLRDEIEQYLRTELPSGAFQDGSAARGRCGFNFNVAFDRASVDMAPFALKVKRDYPLMVMRTTRAGILLHMPYVQETVVAVGGDRWVPFAVLALLVGICGFVALLCGTAYGDAFRSAYLSSSS